MSNLIKNELTKIFKKKSIYITLIVILGFVILTNCIYKYFYGGGTSDYYSEDYIQYVKESISHLDPEKPSDTSMYIDFKTTLDMYEITKEFEESSWQAQIINQEVSNYVSERNTYLYGVEKNEEKVEEINKKINEIIERLRQDDWKYFAEEELKLAKEKVQTLEETIKNTEDKQELENLEVELENAKIDLEVANYRIEKEIKYGNDYRNRALNIYQSDGKAIVEMENRKQELSYAEKQSYESSLENKEISKYVIENNVDVTKTNDIRGIFSNFFNEYGLFILVMVIMIAGTIVSEEFNKGTIKLLLVKPYSRRKILLAKYITVLIMIVFAFVAVILMELVVGGIFYGYESLQIPVVNYSFISNSLVEMNAFAYLGIQILAQLPIVILLATLAFAFSTIFTNSAVAIALPLLGFMGSQVINMLAIQYNVNFLKFFVTLNWDFSPYIFGNLPSMQGLTAGFSLAICIIYFFIMLIPTFIIFKKKNIKNI